MTSKFFDQITPQVEAIVPVVQGVSHFVPTLNANVLGLTASVEIVEQKMQAMSVSAGSAATSFQATVASLTTTDRQASNLAVKVGDLATRMDTVEQSMQAMSVSADDAATSLRTKLTSLGSAIDDADKAARELVTKLETVERTTRGLADSNLKDAVTTMLEDFRSALSLTTDLRNALKSAYSKRETSLMGVPIRGQPEEIPSNSSSATDPDGEDTAQARVERPEPVSEPVASAGSAGKRKRRVRTSGSNPHKTRTSGDISRERTGSRGRSTATSQDTRRPVSEEESGPSKGAPTTTTAQATEVVAASSVIPSSVAAPAPAMAPLMLAPRSTVRTIWALLEFSNPLAWSNNQVEAFQGFLERFQKRSDRRAWPRSAMEKFAKAQSNAKELCWFTVSNAGSYGKFTTGSQACADCRGASRPCLRVTESDAAGKKWCVSICP